MNHNLMNHKMKQQMNQRMKQQMKQNRRNFSLLPGPFHFVTAPRRAYFAALRFFLKHAAGFVATVRSVCLWAIACGGAHPGADRRSCQGRQASTKAIAAEWRSPCSPSGRIECPLRSKFNLCGLTYGSYLTKQGWQLVDISFRARGVERCRDARTGGLELTFWPSSR